MKLYPGDEPGQDLVEYALALILFAVVLVISLVLLGPSLRDFLEQLVNYFSS